MSQPRVLAVIDYDDPYVQPLILDALRSQLPEESYSLATTLDDDLASSSGPILQFRAYETLDFELGLRNPACLANAYVIRKALIRKHFLSNTILSWVTKRPDSVLKLHFKPTVNFELDYAEFLEEALVEAYELHQSFRDNQGKEPAQREWWILKPGMSDRGHGIRLFSTANEITSIFEEWDAELEDEDESSIEAESQDNEVDPSNRSDTGNATSSIMTSQLRHFVAQPYIFPPLLMPDHPFSHRKFHIRAYVLAAGALRVYVYKPMLALFASLPYTPPWTCFRDLSSMQNRILTNTCVQQLAQSTTEKSSEGDGSVYLFDRLALTEIQKENVKSQIYAVTSELFQASIAQATNFQPLPNSFEIFGIDFLVDADINVWLLEVNAFPDFAQTGAELRDVVIKGLFEEVASCAIAPFFGIESPRAGEGSPRMFKVLDVDLGKG